MDKGIEDTPRVIEKYTTETGEVDVTRMASKMSSIKEQNITFKRIILFGSLFLLVAVGLMISTNILGTYVLKDTKVKDNRLVTTNDQPVRLDVNLYKVPIYLFTNQSVLDGLRFLEVPTTVNGAGAIMHMEIDSYIYTPGKQIIFMGEKYCLVLNRHNYQLFLNDASFDPLTINSTSIIDIVNNSTDSTDNSTDSTTTPSLRSIFRSEDVKPKRIHHTIEGAKRHVQGMGEGDISQEFVILSGKSTVPSTSTGRATTNNLNYHGGSLVTNGKVIPIVWYDTYNGNFNAPNLKTCYHNLPTFYNDLLNTKLFTQLTPGKKGSDAQSRVTSIDSTVHYLTPDSSRRKSSLSDSDISAQLNSWLNIAYDASKPNSTIPKNTSNKLSYMYMIFFPSGIKLSSGFCSSYCGFHTYSNGYIYAVLPWVGDCMGGCGMSSYVSSFGGSACGSLQSVASHEMTEMATDPYFNGYYDNYGWENADKCAWTSPACFKNFQSGNSYCVQQAWNHTSYSSSGYDAGCTKNFQN